MDKQNNKRIIIAAICVIAFLTLFFQSDNSITPIFSEQSTTIGLKPLLIDMVGISAIETSR